MAKNIKNKIVRRKKKSHKPKKKNVKNLGTWKQRFFILVVIIFVGCVWYIFLCSSFLDINEFDVRGNNKISKEKIINIIQNKLNGQIIACIKKKNYFFINRRNIIEDILKDNNLKNVSITKQFPNKIIVNVQEYNNVVIWCNGETMKPCFLINGDIAQRKISRNNPIITNNKHFIIIDQSQQNISVGDYVMAEEYLQKIKVLSEELVYALDVEIEQPFKVVSKGSNEVQFKTDEGWYIIIDLTQNVNDILDTAKLFIKKVDLPSHRSDLEYVDMRFPQKIFYKMKDGTEQIENNTKKDDINNSTKENKSSEKEK